MTIPNVNFEAVSLALKKQNAGNVLTKKCPQCGVVFCKPAAHSVPRWNKVKHCSRGCAKRALTPSAAERLRAHATPAANGCIEWQLSRNAKGYGNLRCKEFKSVMAHRIAYELANGPIPDGMFVLHRCDNPPCVNPTHLFLGTTKDNSADMVAKGRAPKLMGARNPNARLSPEDIKAIRSDARSCVVLAKIYSVTKTTITAIRRKQIWKSVP